LAHATLLQLVAILVLGILAQWIAWRIRIPSIVLLLAIGILSGPVWGWLNPDNLLGDLLLPTVSLSVAVILYEGGLNLRFRELQNIGGVFLRMITLGVAISWVVGAAAARYVLGFPWAIATLLGAILVVTGPTVIGPILRHLRLRGRLNALLKWEGIAVDPLGATLAVLVFTVIQADAIRSGLADAALGLGLTLGVGIIAGIAAASVLVLGLSRYLVPDSLHNPVSLMLMFAAFAVANSLQEESGLLAVTVMGITLANQNRVSIRHVVEFKETLTVLLISCLFIILAARLQPAELGGLGWGHVAFVAIVVVVARPASVLAATWGSMLTWKERCFLSWMAPRGIVAAAISSVFSAGLVTVGYPRATEIVPVVFLVVFVTVLLYGASAVPLARWLGIVQLDPQGILFVGAHPWARASAQALFEQGIPVFLVDTNPENVRDARMSGLPCLHGSALADETQEQIAYDGLGKMLAVTPNNEVNSLACLKYSEIFGRRDVYQLPFALSKEGRHEVVSPEHRGRLLFGRGLTFSGLDDLAGSHPRVKKTRLTAEFDYGAFQKEHGDSVVPLFVIDRYGFVHVRTVDDPARPDAGDLIISIVRDRSQAGPDSELPATGDTEV